MSQREVNVIKIRDAVSEICGRYPDILAIQRTARVESDALRYDA
ncbi:hypothetical protein BH10PSE16_BH10PSE16_19920 [soil metagenome]